MINCPHCRRPIRDYILTAIDPVEGIQLKSGFYYRTRGGWQCLVTHEFPGQNLFAIVHHPGKPESFGPTLHMANGLWGPFRSAEQKPLDIDVVEIWSAPAPGFNMKVP